MSIEQTLASMAHRQLTQNMPSLASDLLGFELIASNDENTFALGVNVAIIGNTYIYIPTILKNGRIAPVDLMYVPELDQFLPCKDAWITHLQSKKTDLLAVMSKRNRRSGHAGKVDLNMPFQNIMKVASDDVGGILKVAGESLVDALCTAPASVYIPTVVDLIDIAPVNGLKKLASYIESTDGRDNFAEFYSDADINSIINKIKTKIEAAENFATTEKGVKLLTSASSEAKFLPNDDKVKILRDGAIIKDNRGLTTSTIYKTKTNADWMVPNFHGVYELLKNDGNTLTAYVVNLNTVRNVAKTAHNHFENKFAVIPLDDAQKRVAYEVRNDIIGQPYPGVEGIPFRGSNITSILTSSARTFLIKDGSDNICEVTLYNKDNSNVVKDGEETFIYVELDVASDKIQRENSDRGLYTVGLSRNTDLKGIIVGKAGSKTRVSSNYLRVGSDATFVELESSYSRDIPKAVRELATYDTFIQATGRRADHISLNMFKTASGVYIESDLCNISHASDNEAALALVKNLAITSDDAFAMIKEASADMGVIKDYLVKVAMDTQISLAVPEMPAMETEAATQELRPMGMSAEDKKILDAATREGTKEVFDISVLRMLAEEDTPVQIINEWVPALFTALDKLGRILYLCRAGESMQDAYGVDRVDDIEKKLRKQFSELGDMILTMLKGKVQDIDDLINGEM